MTVAFALSVTPHGRFEPDPQPPEESRIDEALAGRLSSAFLRDPARALLDLGAREASTPLPPSLGFFRDLAGLFVTRLCSLPNLEDDRAKAHVELPPEELEAFAGRIPPMRGAEYVTPALLRSLWETLEEAFRTDISTFDGPVSQYLHRKNPVWNLVGRICFHLAENKTDERRPFAFLATYSTSLSQAGRVQHRPLGQALQEYAGANQRQALLALLTPVQRAANQSAFVKELVDSGRIFHPLAWGPAEAHRFLREVPAFEAAGIVVRVPDWWKPRSPPRVSVDVSVGGRPPSALGLSGLVNFDARLALDGEPLTAAEWKTLRTQHEGLIRLRGRWVEVDRQRLEQLLDHWEQARRAHADGLTFPEAMRLLAGAAIAGDSGKPVMEVGDWSRVTAGPWLRDALAGLRDPQGLKAVHPGDALKATLRPYQEIGLRWLWTLGGLGLGACLADDMGLGKTIQVLSLFLLLKHRKKATGPHLLVVPASLLANWQAEAARFAPGLSLLVAHPSAAKAAELAALTPASLARADVVMTTYGSLLRLDVITRATWDTVVLDEAQAIKNAGAKQTQAAKRLAARAKIVLTGTPVENRLGDLWSLFDFINPGLLGSAKAFGRYVKKMSAADGGGYQPLRELVRPYILRRMKTDRSVIADLPDKTELRAYCSLTKPQAVLYEQAVAELQRSLEEVDGIQRKGIVLAMLLRFKQICNHPSQWLGDNDYASQKSGKFARLRELVEPIAARQEKALVFTQFREMTEPLAAYLGGLFGRRGLVLHGQTPVKKRRELVDTFQADEHVPFMVLSVKAGGTGLNLTAANHVIHFDRWWNPAVENQATDRAFRIGQKRNVLVHKFVCRGTVEEKIDALIESKRSLASELLDASGEAMLTEMNDAELIELVSLDLRRALDEG